MDCSPPGSSVHGDSPGKNTGVGCLFFILGIFPIQGPNLSLLRCRQILYHWAIREAPLHSKSIPYLFKHFPVMGIQFRFQMFAPKKKKKEAPIKRLWKWSCSVMSDSWWPHGLQLTRLLCPWDSPDTSTGVGCHFLLQGIFPSQGLKPGLPHCRQTFYRLSHQGSAIKPKINSFRSS